MSDPSAHGRGGAPYIGKRYARDLGWNAAGLALPLAAAFVSVPLLMRNFGPAGFGVFSLLGAMFAYLAMLDLGLGSAVTYRISAMLARSDPPATIIHLVTTAAFASLGIGVVVAVLAYLAADWAPSLLVSRDPILQQQAIRSMRLLAIATPVLFVGTLLSGVLTGYRRFGQVNAVRIGAGVLGTLGPAAASYFWPNLVVACAVLVVVRLGVATVHFIQCVTLLRLDARSGAWRPSHQALASLLSFGGWLTVSNVLGPFMVYLDRFYLAAVRPIEEVAHYIAPYELVTRIALIPAGVLPVLFPVLVAKWVHRDTDNSQLLVQLATAMALACALPTTLLSVFGPEIVKAWVGSQMPSSSATVLQLLAGAVFVNCVAQVFYMQLQAMGHTNLLARLHFGELILYALLLWMVTQRWGAIGVALAWAARVMIDAFLLCTLTAKKMRPEIREMCWQVLAATLAFGLVLSLSAWLPSLTWRVVGPLALGLCLIFLRRHVVRFLSGTSVITAVPIIVQS